MWALVLLVLAGCDVAFGLTGGDKKPIDAAPVDSDHDGVLDATDNCPMTANADQLDADSDGVGDACDSCPGLANDRNDEDADGVDDHCDNCPTFVNPDQANTDGDGFGDACDASPDPVNHDCVLMFDGFGSDARWKVATARGTWSVSKSTMIQSDPEVGQGVLLSQATFTSARIETRFVATAFTVKSPFAHNVGVWGQADDLESPAQDLPAGIWTELAEVSTKPGAALYALSSTCNAGCPPTATQIPFFVDQKLAPPRAFDLDVSTFVVLDLMVPSSSAGAAIHGTSTQTKTFVSTAAAGHVGLRVNGVAARFDYIVVTKRQTAACPPR